MIVQKQLAEINDKIFELKRFIDRIETTIRARGTALAILEGRTNMIGEKVEELKKEVKELTESNEQRGGFHVR